MHDINFITGSIIDSAMRIHTTLGPGLFESVYEVLLERDLLRAGFKVERQKSLGFEFEGIRFENAFVLDLLVEGTVVVEINFEASGEPLGRAIPACSASAHSPREMMLTVK